MEQQKQFQCTGDCLTCSNAQRQYCASQHAYKSMRMLERMEQQIADIRETIEAIQNNEAMVFDPHQEHIAQSGDGAESRCP